LVGMLLPVLPNAMRACVNSFKKLKGSAGSEICFVILATRIAFC